MARAVAFVICVEEGSLEEQSVLFAESIRKWGGTHADSRIVSVEPRGESGIADATLRGASSALVSSTGRMS